MVLVVSLKGFNNLFYHEKIIPFPTFNQTKVATSWEKIDALFPVERIIFKRVTYVTCLFVFPYSFFKLFFKGELCCMWLSQMPCALELSWQFRESQGKKLKISAPLNSRWLCRTFLSDGKWRRWSILLSWGQRQFPVRNCGRFPRL